MRVRYDGSTYDSTGSAMRAIDEDLQNLSNNLSQFIGSSVPDGLSYSNNYLQLTLNGEPYASATQWIYKGNSATDPYLPGTIEKSTKKPTAEKSFEYSKWDKSFNKVEEPLNINPIFTETINTYIVQF